MPDSRIMIAATGSGSGKTIITCAIMRILKNSGLNVTPFKCGPDYIDPMYHRAALGMDIQALSPGGSISGGGNPDTFFTDRETTIELMYEGGFSSSDISVTEGVMGLYDGLGGTSLKGSSYELASFTDTPVILVVNAKGMGRSVLSIIKGFLDYDGNKLIRGIILNRVSGVYYRKLKTLIEDELKIPVAGYAPDDERLHVGSRHLGLLTPTETNDGDRGENGREAADILKVLDAAEGILKDTLDIGKIRLIAESSGRLLRPGISLKTPEIPGLKNRGIKRIAVAVDEAFSFYYRENLRFLKALGTELIPFSPLHDTHLPQDTDALLLGGGYPEEYLEELSSNIPMKDSVKSAALSGKYIIAECGGFMYLQEVIEDKKGTPYKMCGVLPGRCSFKGRLTRFGYMELYIGDTLFKGHEFHYYDSDRNGEDLKAVRAGSGRKYRAMYYTDNIIAGFMHLYYYSGKNMTYSGEPDR